MGAKWKSRQVGNVTVIDAAGRITLGEATNALRDTFRELVAEGHKNMVLNLAETAYMDSSGIGELVATLAPVSAQGGGVRLLNLSPRVKELLKMTNVITLFQTFTEEDAAVRSFS